MTDESQFLSFHFRDNNLYVVRNVNDQSIDNDTIIPRKLVEHFGPSTASFQSFCRRELSPCDTHIVGLTCRACFQECVGDIMRNEINTISKYKKNSKSTRMIHTIHASMSYNTKNTFIEISNVLDISTIPLLISIITDVPYSSIRISGLFVKSGIGTYLQTAHGGFIEQVLYRFFPHSTKVYHRVDDTCNAIHIGIEDINKFTLDLDAILHEPVSHDISDFIQKTYIQKCKPTIQLTWSGCCIIRYWWSTLEIIDDNFVHDMMQYTTYIVEALKCIC